MNCRDIEPLLLAERDSVLTNDQHASLERHVAACSSCQQLRARLGEAAAIVQADVARVRVPDAEAEWQTVRSQLSGKAAKSPKPRPLAPVIWFGTTLATAAAVALAYFGASPKGAPQIAAAPAAAQAEYVEAGDSAASTMVYVDKDSGWLVVWAANAAPKNSG